MQRGEKFGPELSLLLAALWMPGLMLAMAAERRLKMTPEEIYDAAYKKATGEGEHHAGAHHRGLQAIYDEVLWRVGRRSLLRVWLHRLIARLERKIRP